MPFYMVLISFIILIFSENAKLPIVKMSVQNAIQIIIVKKVLMEIIMENVSVRKAITMISKIAFV